MANVRVSGTYITNTLSSEHFKAFIPTPLPPDPPLELSGEHYALLDKATLALGRLDGLTVQLPGDVVSLYTYFYIRKEAVLSSQIEGTQSSLSDLILYESNDVLGVPTEDMGEILQYVKAMKHGLKRLLIKLFERLKVFWTSSRTISDVSKRWDVLQERLCASLSCFNRCHS